MAGFDPGTAEAFDFETGEASDQRIHTLHLPRHLLRHLTRPCVAPVGRPSRRLVPLRTSQSIRDGPNAWDCRCDLRGGCLFRLRSDGPFQQGDTVLKTNPNIISIQIDSAQSGSNLLGNFLIRRNAPRRNFRVHLLNLVRLCNRFRVIRRNDSIVSLDRCFGGRLDRHSRNRFDWFSRCCFHGFSRRRFGRLLRRLLCGHRATLVRNRKAVIDLSHAANLSHGFRSFFLHLGVGNRTRQNRHTVFEFDADVTLDSLAAHRAGDFLGNALDSVRGAFFVTHGLSSVPAIRN